VEQPRYQVFLSSTYKDLRREREKITAALLRMNCFVAGMEVFPASSESAWDSVKKIIEQCDYYLVVTAGKYGSVDPASKRSFTEREYDHAIANGIPTLACVYDDLKTLTGEELEDDDEAKASLDRFREKLKKNHYVRRWSKGDDLAAYVTADMYNLFMSHPRPGWVRADPDRGRTGEEISSLRGQVIELQSQLEATKAAGAGGNLARGEDPYEVVCQYTELDPATGRMTRLSGLAVMTWNDIFTSIGPLMYSEESEGKLQARLAAHARGFLGLGGGLRPVSIDRASWNAIKVQLRALGYIEPSPRRHSVADPEKYWTLTKAGEGALQEIAAIRRGESEAAGS
jgi:hypothetical protein